MPKYQFDYDGQPIMDNNCYIETINQDIIPCDGNYLQNLNDYLNLNGYQDARNQEKNTLGSIESFIDLFDRCIGIEAFHSSNGYMQPSYLDETTKITYQQFLKINQQHLNDSYSKFHQFS